MKSPSRQGTIALVGGLLGGPLFLGSLVIFGALTPGFSHAHKSVSELGGQGMPWGLWFNLFGLLVPGLFAVGVAVELRQRLRAVKCSTRWATGLLIFAAMLALTAVPADFSRMFRSPWTWAHAFFALGSPVVFFAVLPGCAKAMKRLGASTVAARTFVVLGYLAAAEFLLYGVFRDTPGLVQRLMILTIHLTIAWLSWTLLRLHQARGK